MIRLFKKAATVTGLLAFGSVAFAQFTSTMSYADMVKEIQAHMQKGETVGTIAKAAAPQMCSAAGSLTTAIMSQGQDASGTISAVLAACGTSDNVSLAVINAAKAGGVDTKVIRDAALLAGVSTDLVTTATAAGGNNGGGDGLGNGGGSNFGSSPRSTFIGGGSSSVSKS